MKNKNWWKAAGWRALRTVAQTALATIGTTTVLTGVDWLLVLGHFERADQHHQGHPGSGRGGIIACKFADKQSKSRS